MYLPTPIIQFSCNNIMVGNILGQKISSTSLSSDNLCCCCQISIMYWKYLHIVPRQTYTKKLLYSKENKFIYANFINIYLGRHFNKKGEIIALGNIFFYLKTIFIDLMLYLQLRFTIWPQVISTIQTYLFTMRQK